jgi:hypothetical protein
LAFLEHPVGKTKGALRRYGGSRNSQNISSKEKNNRISEIMPLPTIKNVEVCSKLDDNITA